MNKIILSEIDLKNPVSLIAFIVSNARLEVNKKILELNGINVSRYTNKQVVDLLAGWLSQHYNISAFLDVPYYGEVVFPLSQYAQAGAKGAYSSTRDMGEDDGTLNGDGTTSTTSNGQTFTQILGQLSNFVTSLGTAWTQIFGNHDNPASNLPPAAPSTTGSQLWDWIQNNVMTITISAIVLVGSFLLWKFRKKIFGKKIVAAVGAA